jgi:predicted nuclease of predicted toxin-antitoxin system
LGLRESKRLYDRIQDADFVEMAALLPLSKVTWLRVGNQLTATIATLLRRRADLIIVLEMDDTVY